MTSVNELAAVAAQEHARGYGRGLIDGVQVLITEIEKRYRTEIPTEMPAELAVFLAGVKDVVACEQEYML